MALKDLTVNCYSLAQMSPCSRAWAKASMVGMIRFKIGGFLQGLGRPQRICPCVCNYIPGFYRCGTFSSWVCGLGQQIGKLLRLLWAIFEKPQDIDEKVEIIGGVTKGQSPLDVFRTGGIVLLGISDLSQGPPHFRVVRLQLSGRLKAWVAPAQSWCLRASSPRER